MFSFCPTTTFITQRETTFIWIKDPLRITIWRRKPSGPACGPVMGNLLGTTEKSQEKMFAGQIINKNCFFFYLCINTANFGAVKLPSNLSLNTWIHRKKNRHKYYLITPYLCPFYIKSWIKWTDHTHTHTHTHTQINLCSSCSFSCACWFTVHHCSRKINFARKQSDWNVNI